MWARESVDERENGKLKMNENENFPDKCIKHVYT